MGLFSLCISGSIAHVQMNGSLLLSTGVVLDQRNHVEERGEAQDQIGKNASGCCVGDVFCKFDITDIGIDW